MRRPEFSDLLLFLLLLVIALFLTFELWAPHAWPH